MHLYRRGRTFGRCRALVGRPFVERLPRHPERLDRLEPLQLQHADGIETVPPATPGQGPDQPAHIDRARVGGRLEPRRLDHRGSVTVMGDEVHVTGADPDAQHEPFEIRGGTVVEIRGLLSPDRRAQRVAGRVEDRHEPVTGALDHRSTVAADGLAQHDVERGGQSIGRIVPERRPLRGGTDQVAEQHGRRRHPAVWHSPILAPNAPLVAATGIRALRSSTVRARRARGARRRRRGRVR